MGTDRMSWITAVFHPCYPCDPWLNLLPAPGRDAAARHCLPSFWAHVTPRAEPRLGPKKSPRRERTPGKMPGMSVEQGSAKPVPTGPSPARNRRRIPPQRVVDPSVTEPESQFRRLALDVSYKQLGCKGEVQVTAKFTLWVEMRRHGAFWELSGLLVSGGQGNKDGDLCHNGAGQAVRA